MNVDNIFDLLNKFGKEEDQISAGFGFLLKNNIHLLDLFLRNVGFKLKRNELKKVDIETQVCHDSGESRIDLQLQLYDRFIIFVESKLYRNEVDIVSQLKKYTQVLGKIKQDYGWVIKLVYVNKYPIDDKILRNIRERVGLKANEFSFFSWEDWIRMTSKFDNKETVRLFQKHVGDKMYSERIIKEQKIKEIREVLVIHTNPQNWDLITTKRIAVQADGTPDAMYLAFYRTHRKDGLRQAITHIAEVKSTKSYVKRSETIKGVPSLKRWYRETGRTPEGTHKVYYLGPIIKLSKEIPLLKGGKTIGQQKFITKMSELLRVNNISELVKLSDLEK